MKKKLLSLLLAGVATVGVAQYTPTIANAETKSITTTANGQAKVAVSNVDKASAVIKSFVTGDPKAITDYVSKDNYVQHNLAFADGRQTMLDALPALKAAGTTVQIVRAFEDGNYVILQSKYNLFGAGEQVGLDIFRFKDGVIVEHLDNLAAVAKANPSGHTQFDGTTTIKDLDKTEANKLLVSNFVRDVLGGQDPNKITNYFDGDKYIQHNTGIADGLSGLGAALEGLSKQGISMVYNKTHYVLGQGNFVLAVSEGTFGGKPTSYYDLFRVENGKIAEHWDVMETIADKASWKNKNGKFYKSAI